MVRRDVSRVRCFTRGGHDWADRFPAIVDAASRIKAFLIDGEAVIARDDGMSDFHALRSRRKGHEAVPYAFDLIERDGVDLRDLPLIERKRRLARLLGRAKQRSIQLHGAGGHRVKAGGRGLPPRAVKGVAEVPKNPANAACAGSARRSGAKRCPARPRKRHDWNIIKKWARRNL